MLQIRGLTRRFGAKLAVDDVSLDVPAGQMVGVIGRSGAGKSTLLRLINRLLEANAGTIRYGSTDVTALKGRALRNWRTACAMIFQQFNLIPRLDVLTNVLIGRLNHRATLPSLLGLFTAAERAMALQALERFDLADVALVRADQISGGQMQRVAICRALLQEPRLILADEPIASLDPRNAEVVMEALRRINREDGLTVLCNLHHLDTARLYCDRIVGMQQGRIVFDGKPAELTADRVRDIYGASEDELRDDLAPKGSLAAA
ncbi:phosphonate ABC transporter ATP-binding protein [Limobrevibacterium gyesilva]|nr:phosphonate ABC transporter ATP-binding protein [Limobrevibacterium gyesilva]